MNDREIMEAAIRHMKPATPPDPDERKGFFRQLVDNLRVCFSPKGKSVTVTSKAKF